MLRHVRSLLELDDDFVFALEPDGARDVRVLPEPSSAVGRPYSIDCLPFSHRKDFDFFSGDVDANMVALSCGV